MFDVWRARIGAVLAPTIAILIVVTGEGGSKTKLSALFAATAILWVSEAIPAAVTALVAVSMSVVLGIATPKDAFAAMGLTPPTVISLAKQNEEIYRPGEAEPIKLSRHSAALRLLQYVRDEAHRFAQHYHHTLRKKKLTDD